MKLKRDPLLKPGFKKQLEVIQYKIGRSEFQRAINKCRCPNVGQRTGLYWRVPLGKSSE